MIAFPISTTACTIGCRWSTRERSSFTSCSIAHAPSSSVPIRRRSAASRSHGLNAGGFRPRLGDGMIRVRHYDYKWLLRVCSAFASLAALITVGLAWAGNLPSAGLLTALATVTLVSAALTWWQTRPAALGLGLSAELKLTCSQRRVRAVPLQVGSSPRGTTPLGLTATPSKMVWMLPLVA
jgi:hypothetical protein